MYAPNLTCYGLAGELSHRVSRVRPAAEQQQRPDNRGKRPLSGNSSGGFAVAKEAPRSVEHLRENPWSNLYIASTGSQCDFEKSHQG